MVSSAQRARLGLGAVCLVFVTAMSILTASALDRQREVADAAPDFTLRDVDGESVTLSSLRGQTVVLLFCSAREPVSIQYSQRIVRFAEQVGAAPNVRILSIDPMVPDIEPSTLDELHVYKRVIEQDFPMLLDAGGQVAAQYAVVSLPTAVVIDPQGYIHYQGAFDDSRDEQQVKKHYCEDAVASLMRMHQATAISTQAFGYRTR